MKKIINVFNNTILILALSIAGVFLYFKATNRPFIKPFIVTSGSMSPTIPTGSAVFVLPSKTYSPGDIITFHPNGDPKTTVTHRLIFTEPTLKTAGDANTSFDQLNLSPDHILGKVIWHVPYVGQIASFAKTPQGFILLVIIPATIVVYEELKSLTRQTVSQVTKLKQSKEISITKTIASSPRFSFPHPKFLVLIPIIGSVFAVTALTASYFSDIEVSANNSINVAVTPPNP